MITVTKQENGVLFTFQDSDKYLYGSGTIEVPFNSLSIIMDESDMITLRKSASYDIFLSARYDTDLGYRSKEEAVEALKGMLYDEAGISEEEVQSMIDVATSGIPSSEVVEQLRTDINTVSGDVQTKADASALTAHADNANVHFSGTQKSNYDGLEAQYYVDDNWDVMPMSVFNDFTNDYSTAMGQFDQRISANTSAIATKADTSAVTAVANDVQTVSGQVQTKVATSDFNTYTAATATAIGNKQDALQFYSENEYDEEMGEEATAVIQVSSPEYPDYAGVNVQPYTATLYASSEGEEPMSTTLIVEANGVTINDEMVLTEGDVDNALNSGSTNPVQNAVITQALNNKLDASALTAHADDTTVHFSGTQKSNYDILEGNYHVNDDWDIMPTSAFYNFTSEYSEAMGQFDQRITANANAIAGKQDVLSAGTGIEISGNVISSTGGGGATYSAGTNISIDSANTINCTLPMRTYNNTSIEGGANNYIGSQNFSFAYGRYNNFAISGNYYGIALGFGNIVSNSYQCSVGYTAKSNRDSSTFGSSGNTLFAVGNGGEGEQVRHNAFEIMQNGDLYFADTDNTAYSKFNQKPLVRLQDMYGALGGLKLVKLTQAEYDALATKDANTLYIISNVVS